MAGFVLQDFSPPPSIAEPMHPTAVIRLAALSAFSPAAEAQAQSWLNAGELQRLAAITAPRRRQQFLAGHRLARLLAAEVGGGNPASWQLETEQAGAPILMSGNPDTPDLHVSLSHSGDWVACAIAQTAIGLDLETGEKPRDLPALAMFTFSPDENAWLQDLPTDEQAGAFYTLWTLKEAQGKHAGTGLRLAESRRQTFCASCPELARAITWQAPGLSLALFGEPGLQARLEPDLVSASARYWRLDSDPAAAPS